MCDPVPSLTRRRERRTGTSRWLVRRHDELALSGSPTSRAPWRHRRGQTPRRPATPVLQAKGLLKVFPVRRGVLRRVSWPIRAVDEINFIIQSGETLGLVGESGSGKSTVARLVPADRPDRRRGRLGDVDLTSLSSRSLRRLGGTSRWSSRTPTPRSIPRPTVGSAIAEPLTVHEGAGTNRTKGLPSC